jgi:hypothetical protein
MNYFQAKQILDGIKDNLSYNLDTINRALELTGDLDIGQLERQAGSTSHRYGSKAWLDSLCQGKGAGA